MDAGPLAATAPMAAVAGGVDCDMHPGLPGLDALAPHLPPIWRDAFRDRGVPGFASIAYPAGAPLTCRPDWRTEGGAEPSTIDAYRATILDRWGLRFAIANPLYGVHLAMSEDMATVLASALNDWTRSTWLDADPRMRASIVVAAQDPERAAAEIDRCAEDPRFVQVLLPVMGEAPLGKRRFWPIHAAAERHGLPVGVHAGGAYRHAVTPVGWPSHLVEDYAAQSAAFQGQLASLICEGVFTRFPALRVVLIESGATWFAPFLWRLSKFWRGCRSEIPWVTRPPLDIARERVRLTAQPFDAPRDAAAVAEALAQLNGDLLLFASDWPHWQFDGDDAAPAGMAETALRRSAVDAPLATYPRLAEAS